MIDHSFQDKLKTLNSSHLPVLPAGIPELFSALNQDEITFLELSKEIERFPTIATRLIVVANSVWSSPVKPINSLSEACSRLGVSVVKAISIALAVSSTFNVHHCPSFNVTRFWCRSLLVADISSLLAKVSGQDESIGIARTAGLLHNLGLLWLAEQLPQEINSLLSQHGDGTESRLDHLLTESLSFNYAQAGSYLGYEWGLPETLVAAMQFHLKSEDFIAAGGSTSILGHAVLVARAVELNDIELMPETLGSALNISAYSVNDQFIQACGLLKNNRDLAQTLF